MNDATEKTQKAFEEKNEQIYTKIDTGILADKEEYDIRNTDLGTIENSDSFCYVFEKTYDLRLRIKK